MNEDFSPFKLLPILSTQEMAKWEQSQLKGDLEQAANWMERAALGIARWFLDSNFDNFSAGPYSVKKPPFDVSGCVKIRIHELALEAGGYSSWRYTLILCGAGGNGGDGWALAKRLKQAGWDPLVAYLTPAHPLTIRQREEAQKKGVRAIPLEAFLTNPVFERLELIVDALLGIGAHGTISDIIKSAIEWANSYQRKTLKVALDCPSGWHAKPVFHADHTLCVQFLKKELLFPPTLKNAGKLHLIDLHLENIGIQLPHSPWRMLEPSCSVHAPIPSRIENKYSRGVIYLVAGSATYPGSAILSERGAWMAEPGMVYMSSHPALPQSVYLQECPSPLRSASVLAIGPGMDGSAGSLKTLCTWLEQSYQTSCKVLDAGALFHLIQQPHLWDLLKKGTSLTLLTPHEGELDRLLQAESSSYSFELSTEEKIKLTQALCKKHSLYILFKGPISYLIGPQDEVLVEPFATPSLARGGSGDFLTGLIASHLSRRSTLAAIACALREQAIFDGREVPINVS